MRNAAVTSAKWDSSGTIKKAAENIARSKP